MNDPSTLAEAPSKLSAKVFKNVFDLPMLLSNSAPAFLAASALAILALSLIILSFAWVKLSPTCLDDSINPIKLLSVSIIVELNL